MLKYKVAGPALLALLISSPMAWAVPEGWVEDFSQAKLTAQEDGKDLLMDFTGSDWCGWCVKLRSEVFDTDAFKASAPVDFVLVELDYPNQKPQTAEIKHQNQTLAQEYGIQGYPTIILADAEGRPYAQTGYQQGGAEAYLAHLDQLVAKREARDEAFAAAESADDATAKAKALDQAMESVGMSLAVTHYGPTIEKIISLDADDAAGLKSKYKSAYDQAKIEGEMQKALEVLMAGDIEGGIAAIDRIITTYKPEGESLQVMMAIKGQIRLQQGKLDEGRKLLQDALKVAPESAIAGEIKGLLEQTGS